MAAQNKAVNKTKFVTGSVPSQSDFIDLIDSYQDVLVSGTNIKTVNGTSLLGGGDFAISGAGLDANGVRAVPATGVDFTDLTAPTATSTILQFLGKLWGNVLANATAIAANTTAIGNKQATLISLTNLRTVNGQTLLGSTDLAISGGAGIDSSYTLLTADLATYTLNAASKVMANFKVSCNQIAVTINAMTNLSEGGGGTIKYTKPNSTNSAVTFNAAYKLVGDQIGFTITGQVATLNNATTTGVYIFEFREVVGLVVINIKQIIA